MELGASLPPLGCPWCSGVLLLPKDSTTCKGIASHCTHGEVCPGTRLLEQDSSLLFSGISMQAVLERFFVGLEAHLSTCHCLSASLAKETPAVVVTSQTGAACDAEGQSEVGNRREEEEKVGDSTCRMPSSKRPRIEKGAAADGALMDNDVIVMHRIRGHRTPLFADVEAVRSLLREDDDAIDARGMEAGDAVMASNAALGGGADIQPTFYFLDCGVFGTSDFVV